MCLKHVRKLELTFAILKPHITSVPRIVKDIRKKILSNGFYVIRTKKGLIDINLAHQFYDEHKDKFFFNRLVTFMSSGPCYFHILARENAISTWRAMMGPTKVFKTVYTHPNTIRGIHGLTDTRNATHGSDSPESAEREIKVFFPDFSISEWYENEQQKLLNGEYEFNHREFVHKICKDRSWLKQSLKNWTYRTIPTPLGRYELLEKEETDLFILGLREEIVEKCIAQCFEAYLERQAVAFTVHCAYLAWCKVLNVYDMFKDPGDADDCEGKASWEPDLEPEPSVIDSWGSESILGDTTQPISKVEKESEKEVNVPVKTHSPMELGEPDTLSIMSRIYDMGEGEYSFCLGSFSTMNPVSEESRTRSIFTRTLSMSRESLPLTKPSAMLPPDCSKIDSKISDRKFPN